MPTAYAPTPLPQMPNVPTLPKRRLPAGMPREWYIAHNRMLKAMRLAIALLDAGVYTPQQARNDVILWMAELIGVHPPSPLTCALVRKLLPSR